ncbi:fructosamine kinase family protein [Spirulina subsalsa FACHB-351]|uniref:Fructosamine kinase family protein n=1 Tax=Spirulina subsalsa FACHB-351 TaxID=234711 RepID=A0ABT3L6G3_9CYAN|nr:fructosamine kinase family protein [Spirulina subsalsa]MCW6036580.1 fructosamine kinase family protein [Spirulina subsalsa FACHB-351]
MWNEIAKQISQAIGQPFTVETRRSVSGGCINQGYAIADGQRTYFVKVNTASQVEMFAAEALGLKQMYETQSIRVPQPLTWGVAGNSSYIVMEWLEFGRGDHTSWEKMGQNLAAMHRYQRATKFGWDCNNTIGSTPQVNDWTENWADFFTEHRIGFQLRLAKRRGGGFPDLGTVLDAVRDRLGDWQPQPSLVHGDLWSGNAACTVQGEPVILDPATYWGDREVDLAMTELFGGFPAPFYRGYNQAWPLDAGYQERKNLYNIYHILNHFNLFGGGYGSQANRMLQKIL